MCFYNAVTAARLRSRADKVEAGYPTLAAKLREIAAAIEARASRPKVIVHRRNPWMHVEC